MKLHVEPRIVKIWAQFKKEKPPCSIALDGYVKGEPRFDAKGSYANFNHHEDVDRLATRSTCCQVHVAIKQGLIDNYRTNGKVEGNIFVNDPDQDTSLAYWLLQNHERILGRKSEPLINRLVNLIDLLDTTAGVYPIDPLSETMRKIAWIFEPYTNARINGRLFKMDASEMENVIEAVNERISRHVMGEICEIEPDCRYERIGGGDNWAMIKK
jgi:hypothetical protein